MKRLLALVIIASMLFSIPVFAADLDLSSMTTEELVELQDSIQAELNSRGYSPSDEIATGVFVVGRDIRSGIFVFEAIESTMINVYESMEKYESGAVLSTVIVLEGQKGNITLEENQVMVILSGRGRLVEDKPNWAP